MLGRILGSIDPQAIMQTLQEVVADPASNLVVALLLLGLVSLLLLIIIVVLLLFVGSTDDDEDEDSHDAEPELSASDEDEVEVSVEASNPDAKPRLVGPRTRRTLGVLGALAIPALIIAAASSAYIVTAQDSYCVRCHPDQRSLSAVTKTTEASDAPAVQVHGNVRCVSCHEGSQAAGVIGNVVDRMRHIAAYATGKRGGQFAAVPDDRCLGCHTTIAQGVTLDKQRGIRVSHAQPIESGVQCRECHPDAGHIPTAVGGGMSVCVRCHDGKKAPAKCSTCHSKDTALAGTEDRIFASASIVTKGDCGGCHTQKTCDSCHGIRMPHDQAFLAGGHARLAGFEKKVFCFRCHVVNDCGKCHSIATGRPWGHGEGWKAIHMNVTPGTVAGCGCHGRSPYVQQGQDYCLACHDAGIRNRVR